MTPRERAEKLAVEVFQWDRHPENKQGLHEVESIEQAITEAVEEERERCAMVADDSDYDATGFIARAIRGEK